MLVKEKSFKYSIFTIVARYFSSFAFSVTASITIDRYSYRRTFGRLFL